MSNGPERTESELLKDLDTLAEEKQQIIQQTDAITVQEEELDVKIVQLVAELAKLRRRNKELEQQKLDLSSQKSSLQEAYRSLEAKQQELNAELQVKQVAKPQTINITPFKQKDRDPQAEKRTTPRLTAAVDVSMFSQHNFYMGLTENISEGGLFIATYDDIRVGTELELTISLPNQKPFSCIGVVCWVREYNDFTEDLIPGVGVQFSSITDEQQGMIRKFIVERDPVLYEEA